MLIDLSELLSTIDKELDVCADIEMSRFTSKMCDYEAITLRNVIAFDERVSDNIEII